MKRTVDCIELLMSHSATTCGLCCGGFSQRSRKGTPPDWRLARQVRCMSSAPRRRGRRRSSGRESSLRPGGSRETAGRGARARSGAEAVGDGAAHHPPLEQRLEALDRLAPRLADEQRELEVAHPLQPLEEVAQLGAERLERLLRELGQVL